MRISKALSAGQRMQTLLAWAAVVFLGIFTLLLPLLLPERPVWQIIGGTVYAIAILYLMRLMNWDTAGMVLEVGDIRQPHRPVWKHVLIILGQVLGIWLVITIFGALFAWFPFIYPLSTRISPVFFVAGSFMGTVVFLAVASWWRKYLTRRYGY